MDKANPSVRKYLAQRAELMGAIRLPNNAFKENAGTEVTTDILFLRKRERVMDIDADWIHLGRNADGVPLNAYFAEHPEMVLGRMVNENKLYGREDGTACVPFENADLSEQLERATDKIEGKMLDYSIEPGEAEAEWIPADPGVKNWSYTLVDDEIYYRRDSKMFKENLPEPEKERLKGLLELEGCVRTLIERQQLDYPDEAIQEQQKLLNDLYDDFTDKHGLISDRANAKVFNKDSAYYLLCSLEVLDENGKLERKADMFSKRTIRRHSVPETVDTATEALAVSISEKACVDTGYMFSLTGMEKEKIINDLEGLIFPNPQKKDNEGNYIYETADEYLSGPVRQKLEIARIFAEKEPEIFSGNVTALEGAQPARLEA
jgi:N12 class adenine-specific DNA methylase